MEMTAEAGEAVILIRTSWTAGAVDARGSGGPAAAGDGAFRPSASAAMAITAAADDAKIGARDQNDRARFFDEEWLLAVPVTPVASAARYVDESVMEVGCSELISASDTELTCLDDDGAECEPDPLSTAMWTGLTSGTRPLSACSCFSMT